MFFNATEPLIQLRFDELEDVLPEVNVDGAYEMEVEGGRVDELLALSSTAENACLDVASGGG